MSQRIAAIELAGDVAHAVVVEATMRKQCLNKTVTVHREEEETDELLLARLQELLDGHFDSIAVACDSNRVSARLLDFPFGDLRKIDAAVGFELEGQIPYNLDDVALSYLVTERGTTRSEVLASLMPRDCLERRLTMFKDAGLEPRVVASPVGSLMELLPPEHADRAAVLSMGHTEAHLALISNATLRSARTMRLGTRKLEKDLAKLLGISEAHAADYWRRIGLGDGDGTMDPGDVVRIQHAVRTALKGLASHLFTTFKALPDALMPETIYVTGDIAALDGICGFLSEALEVNVVELNLKESLEGFEPESQVPGSAYAPALGLVLALLRRSSAVPMNFRHGDFAYQGDLQLYRGPLTHFMIGSAIVLLLALGSMMTRYVLVNGQEEALNKEFCLATEKIVGRQICDPTAALATLRQPAGAGDGVVIPEFSSARMFEAFSKTIPPATDVTFTELEFRLPSRGGESEKITAKGEAANFETTEQVVAALKKDPCVEEAEVSRQRRTKNSGRVEFNLAVNMKCPPGVLPGTQSTVANLGDKGGK
ncbi:MAG: pilus assembly protein PilM [Deltaproteobacteria bacterium]|nr:pilus assembly protein PilM [Deltaproteobacteria bacterium]MBT6432001.1 pilus assembly protein PilM [Deltaproteobacteria bacterium]